MALAVLHTDLMLVSEVRVAVMAAHWVEVIFFVAVFWSEMVEVLLRTLVEVLLRSVRHTEVMFVAVVRV